jgi:ATP-dependent DNA ligase
MPDLKTKAHFVDPMLLQSAEKLPEGGSWLCELKLDGFRAEAIRSGGRVHLRLRNDKNFNTKYPVIVQALGAMPDETVIDGEIVAVDETGRLKPDHAQAHFNMGNALTRIPGRLSDAIEELQTAVRIQPDFAEAHNALGFALAMRKSP